MQQGGLELLDGRALTGLGRQKVAKFREEQEDEVHVHLAVLRLAELQTECAGMSDLR